MRAEVRQKLIAGVSEVQGRVFELHGASIASPKPFIVLKEASEQTSEWWGGSYTTTFQVWVYTKRESFTQVDSLAREVIDVLSDTTVVTAKGDVFLLIYWGMAGPDTPDDEWEALARPLNFRAFSLGWLPASDFSPGYAPDPISTLQRWTNVMFPMLQTSATTWSPTNPSPGLFWRMAGVKATAPRYMWGSLMSADVRCHILAPSLPLRMAWARRVTENLERQRRLTLDDGSDLEIVQGTASFDASVDPFRAGQLRLTAQYGVLEPNVASELGVQFYQRSPAPAGSVKTVTASNLGTTWSDYRSPSAPYVPTPPTGAPIQVPNTQPGGPPFTVVTPTLPASLQATVPGDVVVIAAPPPSALINRVNVNYHFENQPPPPKTKRAT